MKMDAIILTAGKGTRLKPLTKNLPKPLFPIAGKPLLKHILDSMPKKITKVIIVIGYESQQIKDYVIRKRYPFDIIWVYQEKQLGTGHAVYLCKPHIQSEYFFMMYGDIFVEKEIVQDVISFPLKEELTQGVIATVQVKFPEKYGCLEIKKKRLVRIWEKHPEPPSRNINAGLMLLPKIIFSLLEEQKSSSRGEIELTDSINSLVMNNIDIACYEILGHWTDTGFPWDLLYANSIGLQRLQSSYNFPIPPGVTVIDPLRIEKDVNIRPGTYMQGPIIIKEKADIGPNCYLRKSSFIGKGVRIGNSVEIKNSILLEGTTVGHLSYIGDSILGKNCNFGAGTKVANLRLDDQTIPMTINGKKIDSGRRKLGVIMGDNVKTGINVSIMPGIIIGENSRIGAHTIVSSNVPPNSLLYYDPDNGRIVLKKDIYG
jgi:bifunctional UDP-N-acetylglucosamine pyrophosphorylase/glucosamine-1-phosphate N-acetyltransferase